MFWPARAEGIHLLEWYGLTVIVALPAMGGLIWLEFRPLIYKGPRATALHAGSAKSPSSIPAPTDFPEHLLTEAICLQMTDHYVRVHTKRGSSLHSAVLRDLVAALSDEQGLQVHRSWWVAREAIDGWYNANRSATLVLTNGLHVPVARNRLVILRELGWLDGIKQLNARETSGGGLARQDLA